VDEQIAETRLRRAMSHKGGNVMAANPNIANPGLSLHAQPTASEASELKITLRQRIEALLRDVFEGHEEFLGRTPD
jgi:hypothetical protein